MAHQVPRGSVPYSTASHFIEQLASGQFDGRLTEVIRNLTHDQLLEICRLLAERERLRASSAGNL